jgi:short-subunit dehydrogenase
MSQQAALVTGASSGIGEDLARQLVARGYAVILVARRRDRLETLAGELEQAGGRCHVLPCDLADREQLNGLMGRAREWLQAEKLSLTVLVNNAGTGVWDWFVNQPREVSQRDIDVNVTALTTLSHDFVELAREHGQKSRILNIASLAGILPTARFAVYSATKAFVIRLTEIMAYELRDTDISVTASCPGGVLTEFMDHSGQTLKGDTGMMKSDQVARASLDALFSGRTVFVPGAMNRASAWGRILPRWLKMRIVEKAMLVTVEDK